MGLFHKVSRPIQHKRKLPFPTLARDKPHTLVVHYLVPVPDILAVLKGIVFNNDSDTYVSL